VDKVDSAEALEAGSAAADEVARSAAAGEADRAAAVAVRSASSTTS
jgi:hypothetical protein